MMSSNKILTVSYGTFSCTLEGFEDSFDTMKAIAEYFRDLAADDRYFGAEPPQPDAEMLARIAEREVSRRVEAREHEGRIMLKAHEDVAEVDPEPAPADATPATAAAAAVVAAAATHAAPEEDEALLETQAFSAPYTDTPEPPASAFDATEFAAADVAAVEDVAVQPAEPMDAIATADDPLGDDISEIAAFADAPEPEDVQDLAALDGHVEDTDDTAAPADQGLATPDGMEAAAAFFADSVVENAPETDMEDTISVEAFTGYISAPGTGDGAPESAQDVTVDAEEDASDEALILETDDAPEDAVAAETFADKLARIRAVVTKNDQAEAPEEYDEEDTDAIAGFADTSDATAEFDAPEMADASEAAEDADDAPEPQVVAAEADGAVQTDVLAQAATDIEAMLDDPEHDMMDDEADDLDAVLGEIEAAGDNEAQGDAIAHFAPEDLAEFASDDDQPSENIFDDQDIFEAKAPVQTAQAETPEEVAQDIDSDNATPASETSDEISAQPEMAGRVMKVTREAFDEALATGELEEMDAVADKIASKVEVTAESAAMTARDSLPVIDADSSEDLSRLMAEADHQMEEPEGRTRRSAFSHLRAAVAARFADRSMDRDAEEAEEQEEVYRNDLADVVKPRRPDAPEAGTNARPDTRPAPLKLVAEQRIDPTISADQPVAQNDVAPRRVAAPDMADSDVPADTGFAAYAEERGAAGLSELLEAAASYMCFVEGREEFSRPQLMTRVRQADIGEFTREDGLRSFGQLLRTGKIEKIAGGRFAASDAIGYKPDHRAAG